MVKLEDEVWLNKTISGPEEPSLDGGMRRGNGWFGHSRCRVLVLCGIATQMRAELGLTAWARQKMLEERSCYCIQVCDYQVG